MNRIKKICEKVFSKFKYDYKCDQDYCDNCTIGAYVEYIKDGNKYRIHFDIDRQTRAVTMGNYKTLNEKNLTEEVIACRHKVTEK